MNRLWYNDNWIDLFGDKMMRSVFIFRAWSTDEDIYDFAVYESLRDIAFQDALDQALSVFGEDIKSLEVLERLSDVKGKVSTL